MGRQGQQRPFRIGVFFNRQTKASREQVIGIFNFAGLHPDWDLHLFTRPESADGLGRLVGSFEPDGVIAGHVNVLAALRRRLRRRIPGVIVDCARPRRPIADCAFVQSDDDAIGAAVAREYLRRGFANFAFAGLSDAESGADSDARNSVAEERGFVDELARHGRTADVYRERLPSAAWHFEDDARFTRWLQALPKPCALLVHTDTLALSVYAACRRAKIAIPAQLAVTGIGNEEGVCESATPPLSSVEPDYRLAGSRAAEILDGLLRGHRRGGICERYGILRLEERMSSRKVSGSRHLAQQAHEAIRTRAFTPLRVADLAKEAGVSLRTLEKAYADVYGVSLREDLLRQRLAEAKRLLGFSSTPIGELHAKCGFRTASALKAAFVRRFAVSPRAFRQRLKD